MTQPQTVILDLDGTLIDNDAGWPVALAGACEELSVLHSLEAQSIYDSYLRSADQFWQEIEREAQWASLGTDGAVVRRLIWQRALLAVIPGADETAAEAASLLYSSHRRRHYHAYPDVIDAVEWLAGRYRLGVITNGYSDQQNEKLAAMGIARHFEVVVASGDHGIGKPDPAIFDFALAALNADRETTWHIGDSLPADVGGALASGLTAVWLNRTGAVRGGGDPRPHHEIVSLAELRTLLEKSG